MTIAIGADNQAVAGSDADQFDFTSGDTTTETGTTDAVDLAHVDAVNADNAPDQISSSDPDQPISLGDDEAATLVGVGEADEMDHLL